MRILVVGGAGYVGSHMSKMLLDAQHEVVVFDNLSTGFRDAVHAHVFVKADLSHKVLLDSILLSRRFDAVMHFGACINVGESVRDPAKYYANNVANTLNLLDAMVKHRVRRLIFSSTAAIFGEPHSFRIDERHPRAPVNPYGRSKLMIEEILADYDRAYGLRHSSLRYFNAAGADPDGGLGERHEPETHLIPLALRAAAGRLPSLRIFGADYDTHDGTCVRDYVHVVDLCRAHLMALERLAGDCGSANYNLGNGDGYTVREVIDTVRKVTRKPLVAAESPRREGDPARLVADSALARQELGWVPRYRDLDTIIAHAWAWECRTANSRVSLAARGSAA